MTEPTHAATFVLVHGAWHGGWCWEPVARLLRARGHRVTTPTQPGSAERAGELSPALDLTALVDDLVRSIVDGGLTDVVLVGHSFGGALVLGAVDALPERIARLVLLDAVILADGESWFDLLPQDIARERRAAARSAQGGALVLPPPTPASLGIADAPTAAWVSVRLTPQSLAAFTTPLRIAHPPGHGLPVTYVACTDPIYPPVARCQQRAVRLGWPVTELAAGHDAMASHPRATAELLERLAT